MAAALAHLAWAAVCAMAAAAALVTAATMAEVPGGDARAGCAFDARQFA
jgi:hypothetical protein